jgi:rhamnogalacturonyl hydrolase YesR/alpha-L-fucosidase
MNRTERSCQLLLWIIALIVGAASPVSAAEDPVSYEPPSVEQITQTLARVRDRLERATGDRIIDKNTKERIGDLSQPLQNAELDKGPEQKFSPYSYPMGVVYSGMLFANEVTDDPKYSEFVRKRFQLFADHLPALASWPEDQLPRNPLRNMLAPGNLDACGAMGAAMARAKRMNIGPNLDSVLDRFANYVTKKQQRLDDGTFCRPRPFKQSIWLDDAYMSVPLLAQLGKISGERKYFDDAATQIRGFHKHLFDPRVGLFTHAGHMANPDNHPQYYWGRANGWFMLATVELLDLIPEDHSDRATVINILKAHARGIATAQSGSGLWHQMLDRPDSYLETSCSAMFIYALAKAAQRGWLDASAYGPVAQAGWNGVTTRIDAEGHIEGTCIGTSYANDYIYYYQRPATDDVHGYGPVLLAGAQMIKLLQDPHIEIKTAPKSPTSFMRKDPGEQHEAKSDRMAWFEAARFGMFIHWGIYAVPAGAWDGQTNYGEWFQLQTKMPAEQYAQFAAQFNPVKFDAKAWAKTAKDAGMKYVVITAKHHDGFCMYGSKLTEYDIVDATPYKKDPLKELADAVRAEGLKFCFYYSVPDWHHPDFPAQYSQRATSTKPGFHGQPKADADAYKYVEYVKGQLRELLTNYGPIGILWFDGGGSFGKNNDLRVKVMHAQEIIDLVHELQPDCLVNNRLGLPGDYGTPEQKIPGEKSDAPFEVCMTLNRHWGYNAADQDWKSAKTVIQNLIDIASKGGNYLLNVGPTAAGEIPQPSLDILKHVGEWMKTNGESIYGTSASPLDEAPKWGRITRKGGKLYLHVFDWPSDGALVMPALPKPAKKAYLLTDPSKQLDISAGTIRLPQTAPDEIDSIVVVETEQ